MPAPSTFRRPFMDSAFAGSRRATLFAAVRVALRRPTTGWGGDLGEVTVWSVRDGRCLASFPVFWGLGGHRLVALARGPVRVVTAAYHVHGLAGYDSRGALVWHRRDLKKVQTLATGRLDGLESVAVGMERRPLTLVNARTGQTLREVRGVQEAYFGPRGIALHVLAGRVSIVAGADQPHRVPLESFGVLDAAFTNDAVAFSEAAGKLRCFSLSGKPLWEHGFGQTHAFEVAWNHELGLWIAVVGGGSVLYLDPRGRIVRRETVMLPGHRCLAPTGDVLVDARGRVFDVARARTRLELAADGRGPARSPGAGRA